MYLVLLSYALWLYFFLNRASFSTNQNYNRNQLARRCFPALDAIYSSSSSEWFSFVCICCDWQEQLLCFRALNPFLQAFHTHRILPAKIDVCANLTWVTPLLWLINHALCSRISFKLSSFQWERTKTASEMCDNKIISLKSNFKKKKLVISFVKYWKHTASLKRSVRSRYLVIR